MGQDDDPSEFVQEVSISNSNTSERSKGGCCIGGSEK